MEEKKIVDVYVINRIMYGHDEVSGKDYAYVNCLGVYDDAKEALEEFDRMDEFQIKEGVGDYDNVKDIKWYKTHTRVDFKAFNVIFKHDVNVTMILSHNYHIKK